MVRQDCAEGADGRQSATGWRFNVVRRVYADEAIIAFIDLLGTHKLYEGSLPIENQAETLFGNLIHRLDIKFCECFSTQEIQQHFDVSIFGDSVVISPRKKTEKVVERLVEFLLEYQLDLLVNGSSPSRAILIKDSFFSFKITGASEQSILGSQYTTVSLCGGKRIVSLHDKCLPGLPIGVYVDRRIERELNTEQRARIVPVRHTDEHADLSFVKTSRGIEDYLPPETSDLLNKRPDIGVSELLSSMKAALQDQDTSTRFASTLGLRQKWDVLRSYVEDQEAFNKWAPWVLANVGKLSEITRCKKGDFAFGIRLGC